MNTLARHITLADFKNRTADVKRKRVLRTLVQEYDRWTSLNVLAEAGQYETEIYVKYFMEYLLSLGIVEYQDVTLLARLTPDGRDYLLDNFPSLIKKNDDV